MVATCGGGGISGDADFENEGTAFVVWECDGETDTVLEGTTDIAWEYEKLGVRVGDGVSDTCIDASNVVVILEDTSTAIETEGLGAEEILERKNEGGGDMEGDKAVPLIMAPPHLLSLSVSSYSA